MSAVLRGQLPLLLHGLVRTLPWRLTLGALGCAAAIVAATHAAHGGSAARGVLPVAAVLVACIAGSAVGDSAHDLLASMPTPLWVRGGLRVGAGFALAAAGWLALLVYVAAIADLGRVDTWTLRLGALAAVSIAAALKWGPRAAMPATIVAIVVASKVPTRWPMLTGSGEPGYAATQLRWTAVLVVSMVAIVAALRDPAAVSGRR